MDVPLWFAVLVVAVLGIQLARPPWWLVVLLLLGGYLVANSVLAPAVATLFD
jgi:F0F1-type ATP synthase assembly protein I